MPTDRGYSNFFYWGPIPKEGEGENANRSGWTFEEGEPKFVKRLFLIETTIYYNEGLSRTSMIEALFVGATSYLSNVGTVRSLGVYLRYGVGETDEDPKTFPGLRFCLSVLFLFPRSRGNSGSERLLRKPRFVTLPYTSNFVE